MKPTSLYAGICSSSAGMAFGAGDVFFGLCAACLAVWCGLLSSVEEEG